MSGEVVVVVVDAAYVRVGVPDLDEMEAFLTDFGMCRVARSDHALYMTGAGIDPVVHVAELADQPFVGFALKVASRGDLEALAAHFATEICPRDEPGGGEMIRFTDPDGNRVEAVFGIAEFAHRRSREPFDFNPGVDRRRRNILVRNEARPSHVMRLGHVALRAADFPAMLAFYRDVLGMRISDSYYLGTPENMIAAFLHCGLGSTYVDHHTVALVASAEGGIEHMAFEVLDMDDLMMGNKHMLAQGRWQHSWGVGRHNEGSQIFDYWRDPFGNKIEHWTDGDLVNDDYPSGHNELTPETAADRLAQWGPPLTPDFMR